jgi:hypothetical protein
MKKNPTRKN